jgi:hypothetical protein
MESLVSWPASFRLSIAVSCSLMRLLHQTDMLDGSSERTFHASALRHNQQPLDVGNLKMNGRRTKMVSAAHFRNPPVVDAGQRYASPLA